MSNNELLHDYEIMSFCLVIALVLTTCILGVLSNKYAKLKDKFNNDLAHSRRMPPIPGPEKYTIIDLIYEQKFDHDELLTFNMSEDSLIHELKKEAAKQFAAELEKLDAIQLDVFREPYSPRPNHYRFITKIALRDEK